MSSNGKVTRFGLRNFKAFHYLEDIELKPLTVLVGANSAGKSSIFQALLLLKQSSEGGRAGGVLKFDGEWTKLGGFANVVSDFDIARNIEYRFETEIETVRTNALYSPVRMRSEFRFVFGMDTTATEVALRRASVRTSAPDPRQSGSETIVSVEYGGTEPLSHQNVYVDSLGAPVSVTEVRAAHVDKFWLAGLDLRLRIDLGATMQSTYMPPELSDTTTLLRVLLEEQLEYLGPVRADPRVFYPIEEEPILGSRGEGAIPYLLRRQHDLVRYAPGPADEIREAPLLEAVNDWLRRMKVTPRLTIDPVESIAFTAAVQSISATRKSVNLSQVGFGISQLLPVLVMGLKKPDDGWLLFEQPEIHLHPRLQGELADFFLATARAGKTVMVETHSDHMVSRLRRRIAEDETGELSKMVQILFVHPGTPDNPSSYVEPLTVDESGTIVNCPADFFSETADEAFAILETRRKRAQKKAAE